MTQFSKTDLEIMDQVWSNLPSRPKENDSFIQRRALQPNLAQEPANQAVPIEPGAPSQSMEPEDVVQAQPTTYSQPQPQRQPLWPGPIENFTPRRQFVSDQPATPSGPPTDVYGKPITSENPLEPEYQNILKREREAEFKDRGFSRGLASDVVGGLVDYGELGLRGLRTLSPKGSALEEAATSGIERINRYKEETPFLQQDPNAGYLSRSFHGGIRSSAQSMAAGLPTAFAGGALGSTLGPAGTAIGALLGYAIGGKTQFGLAQYDDVMERGKPLVDQGKISYGDLQASAIRQGLYEFGFEAASDLLGGWMMGAGKLLLAPAKEAVKFAIRDMTKIGFKEFAKRAAGVAAAETSTEMATQALQSEEDYRLGIGNQRFWDGAVEAFGPSFVASMIFAGLGHANVKLAQRSVLKSLENPEANPEKRAAAVDAVYAALEQDHPVVASIWAQTASNAIDQKLPISTDENIMDSEARLHEARFNQESLQLPPGQGFTMRDPGEVYSPYSPEYAEARQAVAERALPAPAPQEPVQEQPELTVDQLDTRIKNLSKTEKSIATQIGKATTDERRENLNQRLTDLQAQIQANKDQRDVLLERTKKEAGQQEEIDRQAKTLSGLPGEALPEDVSDLELEQQYLDNVRRSSPAGDKLVDLDAVAKREQQVQAGLDAEEVYRQRFERTKVLDRRIGNLEKMPNPSEKQQQNLESLKQELSELKDYEDQAAKLGIKFVGMQERMNKPAIPLFNDNNGATFTISEGETLEDALKRKRGDFAVEKTLEALDSAANEAATSTANELPEPTQAQIEAGNYKKGHVDFQGLDISIENPRGSIRKGVSPEGKIWETELTHHYGYIKGTVGRDKDHVDTFIGPNVESDRVYVVDQMDPKTGKFDEHKVLLGFQNKDEARQGYLSNYEKDWKGIGGITEMSMGEFKALIANGELKKPVSRAARDMHVDANVREKVEQEKKEVPDDRQGEGGVAGPLGEGEKPGGTIQIEVPGGKKAPAGGILQTPQGEAVGGPKGWEIVEDESVLEELRSHIYSSLRESDGTISRKALFGQLPNLRKDVVASGLDKLVAEGTLRGREQGDDIIYEFYKLGPPPGSDIFDINPAERETTIKPGKEAPNAAQAETEALLIETPGEKTSRQPFDVGSSVKWTDRNGVEHTGTIQQWFKQSAIIKNENGKVYAVKRDKLTEITSPTAESMALEEAEKPANESIESPKETTTKTGQQGPESVSIDQGKLEVAPESTGGPVDTTPTSGNGKKPTEVKPGESDTIAIETPKEPEEKPAAPVQEAKQPWEMSRDEFISWTAKEDIPGDPDGFRKTMIQGRISKGLPVPAEVLADYPDLKPSAIPIETTGAADQIQEMSMDELDAILDEGEKAATTEEEGTKAPTEETGQPTTSEGEQPSEISIETPAAGGPRAPRAPRGPREKRTAAEIAESAAAHGVKGIEETISGLYEIFGGKSIKSFPGGIDEDTYLKAKPHFQKALEEFQAAGKDVKAFVKWAYDSFSAKIKPYLRRFMQDLKGLEPGEEEGSGITIETPGEEGGKKKKGPKLQDTGEALGGKRSSKDHRTRTEAIEIELGGDTSNIPAQSLAEEMIKKTTRSNHLKVDHQVELRTPGTKRFLEAFRSKINTWQDSFKVQIGGRWSKGKVVDLISEYLDESQGTDVIEKRRKEIMTSVSSYISTLEQLNEAVKDAVTVGEARQNIMKLIVGEEQRDKWLVSEEPKSDIVDSLRNMLAHDDAPLTDTGKALAEFILKKHDFSDFMIKRWETIAETEMDETKNKPIVRERRNIFKITTPDQYREGRDVPPEELLSTFGLRGLDFGEWVEADFRQRSVNLTYDSFKMLAEAIGANDMGISLNDNQRLGIGWGARGRGGKTAAQFYPGNRVIALTKTKGDGSLAHEWGHAFDFMTKEENMLASDKERPVDAIADLKLALSMYFNVADLDNLVTDLLRGVWSQARSRTGRLQEAKRFLRQEALDAIARDTEFYTNAILLDKGERGAYWSREVEMFARAFEAYVSDKLQGSNTYLVDADFVAPGAVEAMFNRDHGAYPTEQERERFNQLYDDFFSQVEWSEDGIPKLKDGYVPVTTLEKRRAQKAIDEIYERIDKIYEALYGGEQSDDGNYWYAFEQSGRGVAAQPKGYIAYDDSYDLAKELILAGESGAEFSGKGVVAYPDKLKADEVLMYFLRPIKYNESKTKITLEVPDGIIGDAGLRGPSLVEEAPTQDVRSPGETGAPGEGSAGRPGENGGGTPGSPPGWSPGGSGEGADNAEIDLSPDGGRGADTSTGQDAIQSTQRLDYTIRATTGIEQTNQTDRFNNNIAAIRTLKIIESEGRLATAEEQDILVKYSGWGELSETLSRYPGDKWKGRAEILSSLLSDEEIQGLRRSSLDAYYTPPTVALNVYEGLQRLGFPGGKVLEPSCGVGHFFGTMPEDIRRISSLTGIDIDNISSRISRQLYQSANVFNQPFEETALPENFYDLTISNVPFGTVRPYDAKHNPDNFQIHDFFINKMINVTKPGGLIVAITSTGTMDKEEDLPRRQFSEKAELIGAIRLPNGVFPGALAGADILYFRRKGEGLHALPKTSDWVQASSQHLPMVYSDGTATQNNGTIHVNNYFTENPDNVLGKMAITYGRYGEDRLFVKKRDNYTSKLREAIDRLPTSIYSAEHIPTDISILDMIPEAGHIKDFNYYVGDDGKIYQNQGGAPQLVENLNPDQVSKMKQLIGMRGIIRNLLRAQAEGQEEHKANNLRERLKQAYTAFVKKHGPINLRVNQRIIRYDPDAGLLFGLEKWDRETQTVERLADIFTKNTVAKVERPTSAETSEESLIYSLMWRGRVDLPYMAGLTGKMQDTIVSELKGKIFDDPEKGHVTSDEYLSGNVRHKLAVARAASELDPKYKENVEALEIAMPVTIPLSDVRVKLGSAWVTSDIVRDFVLQDLFDWNLDGFAIDHIVQTGKWNPHFRGRTAPQAKRNMESAQEHTVATNDYGTSRVNLFNRGKDRGILDFALNGGFPVVKDTVTTMSGDEVKVVNQAATDAANAKLSALHARFSAWVYEDDTRSGQLETLYNERFNSLVDRKYDGSHLSFPGKVPDEIIKLRDHQKAAIWRQLQSGVTYLAHEVGTGKAQPLDAKILTPDGWKLMGDIVSGDLVIASDGTPTMVEAVFPQGIKEIFRVIFNDGSSTECCEEHLWLTHTYQERNYAQRSRIAGKDWDCGKPEIRSLKEIRETLTAPHLDAKNHSIPIVGVVRFNSKALPIDPYLMGVLIGDGCFRGKGLTFSSADSEVIESISKVLPEDCEIVHRNAYDYGIVWTGKMSYAVGGGSIPSHPVINVLRDSGLWGEFGHNKFIPQSYLFNSVEARIALLQGLMDTDGTADKRGRHISYSTTSEMLSDDVASLVQSLGGTVARREKIPSFTHNGVRKLGRLAYNLSICLPPEIQPFRLSRKAALVKPKTKYRPIRYIVGVEPAGRKPSQCIRVAHPSHLYVTDDYIVTHNTFTMIGMAMEAKRMGLVRKPIMSVKKKTIEQITASFLQLYPGANILVMQVPENREKRKRIFQRIATSDYDCIIVNHDSFKRIPLSPETQREFINQEMQKLERALYQANANGAARHTVRDIVRKLDALKQKLRKLTDFERDDVPTFEEMGLDMILVDEGHVHKNIGFETQYADIKGVEPIGSEIAIDLYMKTQYIHNRFGRGIVMASGTPLTNSVGELYNISRYLHPKELERLGISTFDAWANTFGIIGQEAEPAPEGGRFKLTSRFTEFINIPELMSIVRQHMDVRTAEDLKIPRPDLIGGKPEGIDIEQNEFTRSFQRVLRERSRAVRRDGRNAEYLGYNDNMLRIVNDGRLVAMDPRLYNPSLPDYAITKTNVAVEKIWDLYQKPVEAVELDPASKNFGKAYQEKNHLQLIFCDRGVPGPEDKFNLYADIKKKLIAKGIPRDQIAFIHDAKGDDALIELFRKAKSGEYRVLIGSTGMMGIGVNLQDRVSFLHHLDVDWTYANYEQRNGRGWRFGNRVKQIGIFNYGTKKTVDAFMWSTVAYKERVLRQVMSNDPKIRHVQDISKTSVQASEMEGLLADDPLHKEKIELEAEVRVLSNIKSDHETNRRRAKEKLARAPLEIQASENNIKNNHLHLQIAESISAIEIGNAPGLLPRAGEDRHFDLEKDGAGANAAVRRLIGQTRFAENPLVFVGTFGKIVTVEETKKEIDKKTGKETEKTVKVKRFYPLSGKLFGKIAGGLSYRIGKDVKYDYDIEHGVKRGLTNIQTGLVANVKESIRKTKMLKDEVPRLEEIVRTRWDRENELSQKEQRLHQITQELLQRQDEEDAQDREQRGEGGTAGISIEDFGPPVITEVAGMTIANPRDRIKHNKGFREFYTKDIEGRIIRVSGKPVKIEAAPDLDFFVYQTKDKNWFVIDALSGMSLSGGWSKLEDAIQSAEEAVAANLDELKEIHASQVNIPQPLEKAKAQFSFANKKPWPQDFPKAHAQTHPGKVINHPDHEAAKAGDIDSALRLVLDLVKPEKMDEIGRRYPGAKLVAVHAEEATGRNAIPQVYARALGRHTGLEVDTDIVQENQTGHTKKKGLERLLSRAAFDGPVTPGQTYIIVDDLLTQGGTVSELRHYIVNKGGNVVAVTSLGFSTGSNVVAIKPETVLKLVNKFGRNQLENVLKENDIAGTTEALTNSEGLYILSYSNLDTLRDRIAQEQQEGSGRQSFSLFQREVGQQSLTRNSLESHFAPIISKWTNAPAGGVRVVQSQEGLPSRIVESARGNEIEGVYDPHTRSVWLVADNLPSLDRAEEVLAHEVFGHFGLEAFLGERQANAFLGEVALMYGKAGLKSIADQHGFDLSTKEGRLKAAGEKLAQLAETGERPGLLKRIYAAIRAALRGAGFKIKLDDADIQRLLTRTRELVEGGQARQGVAETQPLSVSELQEGKVDPEILFSLSSRDLLDKLQAKLEGTPKSALDVVFGKQTDLGELAASFGLPAWLGKNNATVKVFQQRQDLRDKDRSKIIHDYLKDTETLYNLSDKDQVKFDQLAFELDGKKVVDLPKFKKTGTRKLIKGPQREIVEVPVYELNDAHYKELGEYLKKEKKVPNNISAAYMDARKALDRSLIQTYERLQEIKKLDPNLIEEYRNQMGQVENYWPHVREGNYHIRVVDPEADPKTAEPVKYREDFNAAGERHARFWYAKNIDRIAGEVRKDNPGIDLNSLEWTVERNKDLPEEVYDFPIAIDAMQMVADAAVDKMPEEAGIKAQLRKEFSQEISNVLKSRGHGAHFIKRRDIPGYQKTNAAKVLYNHFSGFSGWLTKMEAAHDYGDMLREIQAREHPGEYRWAVRYVHDMLQNQTGIDRAVDNAKAFFFMKYLGLGIKTMAVNLTQNPIVGIPRLSMDIGIAGAGRQFAKAVRDIRLDITEKRIEGSKGRMSAEEKRFLGDMFAEGWGQSQFLNEIKGKIGGKTGKVFGKVARVMGYPMEMSEKYNRLSLGLAAFRAAREGTITNQKTLAATNLKQGEKANYDAAKAFAENVVKDSHFVFGKGNRPQFMRGTAGGKALSAVFTFRTFSYNQLSLWRWMLASGDKEGKKAFAYSLLAMIMLGGLSAIPLYNSLASLIREIFGEDLLGNGVRKQLPPGMRDLVMYGSPSLFGVNIGGSIGMELPVIDRLNVNKSVSGQLGEGIGSLLGVPYSMFDELTKAVDAIKSGRPDRAAETVAPNFLKNIMSAERLYREGQTTVTGKPINVPGERFPRKLTEGESVLKGLGFQPVSSTKAFEIYKSLEQLKSYRDEKQSELANRYVAAMRQDDQKEMVAVRNEAREWNRAAVVEGRREMRIDLQEAVRARQKARQPMKQMRGLAKEYRENYGM